MIVTETHIIINTHGNPELVFRCDDNSEEGAWFHAHTGAFGQRDMELRRLSAVQLFMIMGEIPGTAQNQEP